MKSTIACVLATASTLALAQDIPAPLNVTTLTGGRQEIFSLENLNAGVVTGGGDEADLLFEAKTDAGNVYRIGGVGGVVTSRANATRTGDVVLRCGPGEGMSERLRVANDGSVIINGSGPGALRIGTGPTDNRTNTQLQVFSSMSAYASSDSAEADVFAADLNYYNNGTPTWAGAGAIWYGKTRSGNLFSTTIPLAKMALFIGQNSATTAFGTNTINPVYLVNSAGVGVRLNPNLTTSFFGNLATTAAAGEVQIGGGQINASGNIYVQATGTSNASLSLKGANGGSSYYLNSNQGGDQFAIYDGAASVNRMTLSGGRFAFLGVVPTTVVDGQVAIGGGRVMVGGLLSAKEIKVTSTGADYVFADGYVLRALAEVEAFVTRERHLPGMMTAQEMGECGLPVAQVVTVQLAKIEELTLYAIAAERERQRLEERATALDKRNAALEASLAALTARLDRLEAAAPQR